jgi:hypothetical protein
MTKDYMRLNGAYRRMLMATTARVAAGLAPAIVIGSAALVVASTPRPALAASLYNGTFNDQQVTINLETTLEYSNIYRVNDPSAILEGPTDSNGNDGDANFRHGFVDNTFDVVSAFDMKVGNAGAHVSGEAYLDTPYLAKNQNNEPGTFNPYTPSSNRDFTTATRNINGENAILLDAFAYDTQTFGADQGQTLTLKVGRQTLLWGQSLFLTGSGIAAGQAPVDIIKAQSLPNPQAQQVFLPVGQAVLTYQPNQILTFQGYYQFEWEPNTFQGSGAYFNAGDFLDKGGQRLNIDPNPAGPALYAYRGKDNRPTHNGQFGLSVQATLGNYDLGFYGLRFDSKAPEVYIGLPAAGQPVGSFGTYHLVYPRDIGIYGTSLSTTVGPVNVGGEISGRTNMPLVSGPGLLYNPATFAPIYGNANSNPLYAVGDTADAQASFLYITPGFFGDPGGATMEGEAQVSHVLEVTANKAALSPSRDSTAGEFDIEVEPTYYNVLPNLEIQFPISVAYNLFGRSQIDGTENHGTGTIDLGVTGTYETTWIASLNYQDYLGAPNTSLQGDAQLADRGYISFNIQHTF